MISNLLRFVLVSATISPILIALAIQNFLAGHIIVSIICLLAFIGTALATNAIIETSKRELEKIPIHIKSVAPADQEVTVFLFAYILPLVSTTAAFSWLIYFSVFLLYWAAFTTNTYHFNPVVSLLWRYHYYSVTIEDTSGEGKYAYTYVLMTKKDIYQCKDIHDVVQVSEYMLLEV